MMLVLYIGLMVFALNGLVFIANRRETAKQQEKLRKITRLVILNKSRGIRRLR